MDYLEIRALYHHGIKGQKWGIRRYQNEDGSLTPEGKKRLQDVTDTFGRYNEYVYNEITSERINGEPLPKEYIRDTIKAQNRAKKFLKALQKEKISMLGLDVTKKGKSYYRMAFKDLKTGKVLEGNETTPNGLGYNQYEYNFIKVKPEKKEAFE